MPAEARATVLFGGDVQGVGFRYTTARLARGFKVSGYVQNLADGRVRLVAEGERREVEGFIEAVRQDLGGYIGDTQTDWEPATGEFAGFRVRF